MTGSSPASQAGNPLSGQIQTAHTAGYQPPDILNHLAQIGEYTDQIAQARAAGYSDADILNHIEGMAPPPQVSTSPVDAFRNAAADIVSCVGKLGGDIDSAIQNSAPAWLAKATGATNDLQSGEDQAVVNAGQAISGPNQYQPAPVHQLGADIEAGKPMAALNDAAGVVAGAVPYAATAMIPGAGPLLLGVSAAGNTMSSRMQAEGETAPSAGDVLAGAADGAVNTLGGGVAHGVMDGVGRAALSPLAARALGPLGGRYLGRVVTNAAAGGAVGAANNVATNAGTGILSAGGVLNDAEEGAGTGGLAGAVMQAPEARADAATSRAVSAMDPEQAASITRVASDAASRLQGAKAAGVGISPSTAIKALGEQLQGELNARVTRLGQSGDLSTADRQAVIQPGSVSV